MRSPYDALHATARVVMLLSLLFGCVAPRQPLEDPPDAAPLEDQGAAHDAAREEIDDAASAPLDVACAPDCAGRACGEDGCGGRCGVCAGGA
ncbi:hypothetical protein KKB55_10810, partial [Myxococcota bacterium]|nr:hypothetical protein [Myxococcota bacterium]